MKFNKLFKVAQMAVISLLAALMLSTLSMTSYGFDLSTRTTVIVTDYEKKAHNIYPLVLKSIDGKEILPTAGTYHIIPGKHKLKFAVVLNIDELKGVTRSRHGVNPMTFEYDFDGNTRYYIGLKAASKNPKDWEVVIWKKKSTEG